MFIHIKSTRKSYLVSALSGLLCIALLIGATFAWFTDPVTSGEVYSTFYSFSGLGDAMISITDYYFCKTTTIKVFIGQEDVDIGVGDEELWD